MEKCKLTSFSFNYIQLNFFVFKYTTPSNSSNDQLILFKALKTVFTNSSGGFHQSHPASPAWRPAHASLLCNGCPDHPYYPANLPAF